MLEPKGLADVGSCRLPLGTLKKLRARIAPALTSRDKDVSTPERILKALDDRERVRSPINAAIRVHNKPLPSRRHDFERCLGHFGLRLTFASSEKLDGLKHRFPGRSSLEVDRLEETWKEAPHPAVPINDLFVVALVGRKNSLG